MGKKDPQILILGAGASGLGAAWKLAEKNYRNIIVVEKEAFVGGLCSSLTVGKNIVDVGPHRLSPEFPEVVTAVRNLLGGDLLEINNLHGIYFNRRFYHYPPAMGDFLNLPTVKLGTQAGVSLVKASFKRKKSSSSFKESLENKFGSFLTQELFLPMVEKVWGHSEPIDPEFADLRFALPKASQWIKTIFSVQKKEFNDSTFLYPKYGFGQIWETLRQHLEKQGVTFLLNSQVVKIECDQDRIARVTVSSNSGSLSFNPSVVLSTIPAQGLMRALPKDVFSGKQVLLESFKNRGMILAYLEIKRPSTLPARVIIFPEKRFSFNRLSEQNQFSRHTVREGHSVITADLLCDVNSDLWMASDHSILQRVKDECLDCGFFEDKEISDLKVFRFKNAYPLPYRERELAQQDLNEKLSRLHNLYLTGRFASSDYNNSHTALKKSFLAAEAIDGNLPPTSFYLQSEKIRKAPIRD